MSEPFVPPGSVNPGVSVAPAPPVAPTPLWLAAADKLLTALVLIGCLAVYEARFNPRQPAPPPDRIQAAAAAYLAMQPACFEAVAEQARKGKATVANLDESLGKARLAEAVALGDAIKAAPDLADALDRAAAAIRKGMK